MGNQVTKLKLISNFPSDIGKYISNTTLQRLPPIKSVSIYRFRRISLASGTDFFLQRLIIFAFTVISCSAAIRFHSL